MMPLSSQVAPLAESRRLKELGFPQDTLFAWHQYRSDSETGIWLPLEKDEQELLDVELLCAAPTVAELGDAMPHAASMPTKWRWEEAGMRDGNGDWWHNSGPACNTGCGGHASEAEYRARLLIGLAERGLVRFADQEAP